MEFKNDGIKTWKPIDNIPRNLLVKGLIDDFDGFRIVLYEEGQEVQNVKIIYVVSFKHPLGYRNLDESYHLRTWGEQYFPLNGGSLYTTIDGDFIDSFNHLSYDVYKDQIINYIIVTSNDVIEVITLKESNVSVTIATGS